MKRFYPLIAITLSAVSSQAAVVFNHSGSTDPLTEGWTSIGNQAATAAIGSESWRIRDTSPTGGFTQYEQVSDISGSATAASDRVAWGASGSGPEGVGDFAEVSFEVIPEPGTSTLIGGSALLLLRRRRKR